MKKSFTLLIIPFLFVLDRITKLIIVSYLKEGQSFLVWPGVFYLTRVNNTGAAFGLMRGNSFLLAIVSTLCIIGILVVLVKDSFVKSLPGSAALALIAAGAAGNLYDRVHYGYVIDFLDFRIWPVFNIADSGVCVGVLLLIFGLFKTGKIS